MPIHDWSRVSAGTFHDLHLSWMAELRRSLNGGLLPEGYYALAEQVAGNVAPDVLTLQDIGGSDNSLSRDIGNPGEDDCGVAVAEAVPHVAVHDTITESMFLATRRRRLPILSRVSGVFGRELPRGPSYTQGMPVHAWSRVSAWTFHAFHLAWISEIQRALNAGLLPPEYYALAEQVAGNMSPDVLTLQDVGSADAERQSSGGDPESEDSGIAVALAPPKVAVHDTITESMFLATRRRRLVIRHSTGDRIVALIEIVSPGNKERRGMLEAFVDKAAGALDQGYHLLVIDLIPPGPFDPQGIHGAIWRHMGGTYDPPRGNPLTLASYVAGQEGAGTVTCHVEPTAVGAELAQMPLFLDSGHYINVPLEPTYMAAYEGVPRRWKQVIEKV